MRWTGDEKNRHRERNKKMKARESEMKEGREERKENEGDGRSQRHLNIPAVEVSVAAVVQPVDLLAHGSQRRDQVACDVRVRGVVKAARAIRATHKRLDPVGRAAKRSGDYVAGRYL